MISNFAELADAERGFVSTEVFANEEVYRLELERVFHQCWLFVGHETSIPHPGDYIASYMAEDSVIVLRDASRSVRVFLNKCLHRGNKVCLFDKGSVKSFTCTFHGWQYNTEGKLVGVPFFEEAYLAELDREQWSLVEVPRVEIYGDLIFASWKADIVPLEDYLGDVRWFLDRLIVRNDLGGMEIVAGRQRYMMPTNWKLLSDNFSGDNYHTPTSHASAFKAFADDPGGVRFNREGPVFQATAGYRKGPPHGFGGLMFGTGKGFYDGDLAFAERLGPEVVDWVKQRYRRLEARERTDKLPVQTSSNANIFPNFSLINSDGAFSACGLIQWHPRGPLLTEAWQWCIVERDAPRAVKEVAVRNMMRGQAAGGLIAPDDSENFERTTDNLRAHEAGKQPFVYTMALGHEESHPQLDAWRQLGIDTLPRLIGPRISEVSQRQFYRYWVTLMSQDG